MPSFWDGIWADAAERTDETRDALRPALGREAVEWQYTHGVPDPTTVDPDAWEHDLALLARPGQDDVQLALFRDYATNRALYPAVHDWLRTSGVPVLAIWGRNDEIFAAAGANAFRGTPREPGSSSSTAGTSSSSRTWTRSPARSGTGSQTRPERSGPPPFRRGRMQGEWTMISDLSLPVVVSARGADVLVRRAVPDDLHAVMRLLADDPVSAGRGDVAGEEDVDAYASALGRIVDDPNNDLVVVEDRDGVVVGTLQLTVVPGMARRGSTRLLVEAVRVASTERSSGIGSALMRWVVEQAAVELRTPLVQLTSDGARTDAHRFYLRLGFVDSHVGFKYAVTLPDPSSR